MNLLTHLLLLISTTRCSKILGIFSSPGYSQFILCEKLMGELARRGHEVTVISAFEPKEKQDNYRTIFVDGLVKSLEVDHFLFHDQGMIDSMTSLYQFGSVLTEFLLANEKVQKLINSNESFDLVIVEQFVNSAHMGFAQHFKAPLLIFCSTGLSEWSSDLIGNVRLLSTEPMLFSPYTNHMTFFQRLTNSFLNLVDAVYKKFVIFPQHQQLLDKYFPGKIDLKTVIYNASLLLLNSHPSTWHATTLTSAAVEIGGFHVSPKKLSKELQKFLDDAHDGAIFFSLGSNLRSADLPNATLEGILKVFSKLKQRVLWKFEGNIQNTPRNLLISKWLPQPDILAHPNTVAFITHGGLLSTTEAIFTGVPMVGIPVFGDQRMNVARSVQKGVSVYLPLKKLSENALENALKEVLDNPTYRINAKKYSNILRDQPIQPLDLAMYWIEYVIRHGRATHLRNSSLELHWFQLYLLDVIGFVIFSIVIFYYLIKILLRKIFRSGTKSQEVIMSKTKKQKVT